MPIGDQLLDEKERLRQALIVKRSDILRKFVKETLLQALRQDIAKGGSGDVHTQAPKEINHLFTGPYTSSQLSPYDNPASPYNAVWRELDAWATSEHLSIKTGYEFFDHYVSWEHKTWGGRLAIQLPKAPEKPTPPATMKVPDGIDFSEYMPFVKYLFVLAVIACIMCLRLKAKGYL